jgi:hypothetical protein
MLAFTPDPKPLLFKVGQGTRVLNGVVKDGQTPPYWAGARVKIVAGWSSPIYKDHWYKVQMGDKTCDFREEELDMRFRRNR